jgi:hypothetical protein
MSHNRKVDVSTSVGPDKSVTVMIKVDRHNADVTFADGEITFSVPSAEGNITFTVPEDLAGGPE